MSRLTRLCLVQFAVFLAGALVSLIASAAGDSPNPGRVWALEELLNLAQQRSANAFEVSYAMSQYQDGKLPLAAMNGMVDLKFEKHVIADLKTPRFSFDDRTVTLTRKGHQKSYWDPNWYVEYQMGGTATIDDNSSSDRKFDGAWDPLLRSMLLYPPEPEGNGFSDGSLISLLRLGVVHKGTEEFDGRQCCVVDIVRFDGTLYGRAWLDVDRSLAPLQLWQFTNDGKSVDIEWHSRDLVELSGGGQRLWVPIQVDRARRIKDAAIKARITVEKDSAELDPVLSDTMFRPEFPPGTQVQNRVGGQTHVTNVHAPKAATPLAATPLASQSGWGWVIWASVAVAALATLLLLRRRLRATVDAEPKRKRRWFQFSLRTLLIFTLIVAVACAWLGRKNERKRKEREATEAIVKLGGEVWHDRELAPGVWFMLVQSPSEPNSLERFIGENFTCDVVGVSFKSLGQSYRFADEEAVLLSSLPQLQKLDLDGTLVTDSGLSNIKDLSHLRSLDLSFTGVTDAGLAQLKNWPRLEALGLEGTNVTDAGLVNLRGLTELKWLALGAKVTDAGLKNLESLTQLQTLILVRTNVTDAGLAHLKGCLTQLNELILSEPVVGPRILKRRASIIPPPAARVRP